MEVSLGEVIHDLPSSDQEVNMTQATDGYKSSRVPLKIPHVVKDKKFPNMYRVIFEAGGVVPKNLSGMYGKRVVAQQAIDEWVIGYDRPKIKPQAPKNDIPQRKPKVEENGEEKGSSRV